LFAEIGFKQCSVLYDRDPRYAGTTKWNYLGLIGLSIEGITSFTTAPLRLATAMGFIVAGSAFLYALWIIYKTLIFGESVDGYPSLMTVILFLGGVQLISLGIIGEYLGRIFNEAKGRPLYFVQSFEE
jgi:glycosyltransferase involved in cell wall biosynthesis